MSYFGKQFVLESQENFDGFVNSFGDHVSEDFRKALIAYKASAKLDKSGDTYTLTTTQPQGPICLSFKSGVEFDEKLGGKTNTKTVFTMAGDVLTQVQKTEDGVTITTRREFSDNKLVATINSSAWDGTAKRVYTAA